VLVKQLETNVRRLPGIAIIDLRGEIDAFAEQALNTAYAEVESEDPGAVLLNFGEVEYINSTGIALIVSLLAKARKSQRRVLVYGLSEHYLEIFRITRLADFMSVFPDEAQALTDLGTTTA
jgi:anti-anti-sigma factor